MRVCVFLLLVSPRLSVDGESYVLRLSLPSPLQASSEGIAVVLCVCECVPSFSVLAPATFSPHTRETPDLLNCCKKLSPIDRCLLSPSLKWQKPSLASQTIPQPTVIWVDSVEGLVHCLPCSCSCKLTRLFSSLPVTWLDVNDSV